MDMNTTSPKIAFIGAGSATFTRMLIGDILSYPELRDATISLHDIDPERLETAAGVARLTAEEAGAVADDRGHAERRRALDGADYAINIIQVGGHEATVIDHEIPARYGLRQTIGDTLGIGGIFRALRTIPVMEGIAADMADRRPRCLAAQLHEPDGDALLGDLVGHSPEAGRRPLPFGSEHDRRARRAASACPSRRSPSSAPASTTRPSSSASSATARTSIRSSTRGSPPIPS